MSTRYLYTGLIFTLALIALVTLFPLDIVFSHSSSNLISFALWITESGGTYGTLALVMLAAIAYASRYVSVKQKVFVFTRTIISLLVFLAVFAYINEHFTKTKIKSVRPSHWYMLTQVHQENLLDSIYQLNQTDRGQFFSQLLTSHQVQFANMPEAVLQHWVVESGFSFPSGHSFNAFLLASIFSFSLFNATRKQFRKYYPLPFVWAILVGISRIIVGAHHPIDVAVGAGCGFVIAQLFLFFDSTRKWIIYQKGSK
jgi:phosphatidylglycerophosphatase B